MKWLKGIFGTSAEAEKTMGLTVDLVHKTERGELLKVAEEVLAEKVEHNIFARREVDENREHDSGFVVSVQAQAQNTALVEGAVAVAVAVSDSSQVSYLASRAQTPDQDPALDLDPDQLPAQAQDTTLVAGAGAVSDPASRAQTPDQDPTLLDPFPPVPAPDQPPVSPAQPPVSSSAPASSSALEPVPDPVSIIEPIINLVDSIFNNEDILKKYFFSIFIPPEDDNKEKSIASIPSPAPIITPEQQKELRETLQKCANAYNISGDTDLTPSGSIDPQSSSTKTTSKSSQISKEKAQPPVYFGVGIKTELAEAGDEKFLKITNIFEESKLHKENQKNQDNQDNVDYTNQFITHLNCKLNDGEEAKDHSITDIFNKFKEDPNQKEKIDEKIDKIFRDISRTSIKFKISADKSQSASSEVNIDKIIFEKTPDGAYKQKTTTPSTITATIDARNAAAVREGKVV